MLVDFQVLVRMFKKSLSFFNQRHGKATSLKSKHFIAAEDGTNLKNSIQICEKKRDILLTSSDSDGEGTWICSVASIIHKDISHCCDSNRVGITRGVGAAEQADLARDIRSRGFSEEDLGTSCAQLNDLDDVINAGDSWWSGVHCNQ